MSRAEKKLAKLKAEEELKRIKAERKQRQQQDWDNAPKAVKIVSFVIVGILFIWIISLFSGGSSDTSDMTQNNSQSSESSQISQEGLADRVEEAFLAGWGLEKTSDFFTAPDMPDTAKIYGFINEFEDIGSGDVRVYVQTDISKTEAEAIGKHIMSMVGLDIEELEFIVVRGTDGLDVNVSRNDIPALR